MTDVPWPLLLIGLPFWLAPAFLLLFTLASARMVRQVAGAVLAVALTFLYLVTVGLVSGPALPMWTEGLLLWGPTTLVVSGAAFLAGKWGAAPATARPAGGSFLVAAFVVLSFCGGGCMLTPAADMVDVPIGSPSPGLVMPLASNLTLISTDGDCGSESCSDDYLIGSPDGVGYDVLIERLWSHLEGDKGWERRAGAAGCRRSGWFVHAEFCAFVSVEPSRADAVLRLHVSGDVAVR